LTELNEYIGVTNGGKYPVEPMMISMVRPIIKSTTTCGKSRRKVLKHILKKVSPDATWEAILKRDITKLASLAHTIFDDLPKSIVDSIVSIIESDQLDEETYSNVFDFVDQLVLNMLKFETIFNNEGGDLREFVSEDSTHHNIMVKFFPKFTNADGFGAVADTV